VKSGIGERVILGGKKKKSYDIVDILVEGTEVGCGKSKSNTTTRDEESRERGEKKVHKSTN